MVHKMDQNKNEIELNWDESKYNYKSQAKWREKHVNRMRRRWFRSSLSTPSASLPVFDTLSTSQCCSGQINWTNVDRINWVRRIFISNPKSANDFNLTLFSLF